MRVLLAVVLACTGCFAAGAQDLSGLGGLNGPKAATPIRSRQFVELVSATPEVKADRPTTLEFRFRVEDGMHVNSHRPGNELLTPTTLKLAGTNLHVGTADFPVGQNFTLRVADAKPQVLNVYTGEFTVRVPVTLTAGEHDLSGALEYQACGGAACYPVRTLPVHERVVAR